MTASVAEERRCNERLRDGDCSLITHARLRPGQDVIVLDLSARGALIEGASRLLPGTTVQLQLATAQWRWFGMAVVRRCYVSALVPDCGVRYRAALMFEQLIAPLDGSREQVREQWADTRNAAASSEATGEGSAG